MICTRKDQTQTDRRELDNNNINAWSLLFLAETITLKLQQLLCL